MDIDHWIKLLEVLISLLQVLIWPFIAGLALLYLGKTLKNYVDDLRRDKNVSELSAEVGTTGVKLNVKRQVEIVENLTLAKSKSTESQSGEQAHAEVKTREVLHIASKIATSQTVQQVAGARVLWVDDNPSNNVYERRALEALGIQFTLSTSTQDALDKLRLDSYDVIISDMGRSSDKQAGYTLLGELRKLNVLTPFIIYAGSNRPEHKAEVIRRGGLGTTNNPQELFQLVINAIQNVSG
jgi:CheY-like chemotaxis protein